MTESDALQLADLPDEEQDEILGRDAARLEKDWRFWARPEQILPAEGWATAYIRGGRGSGKGWTGSENFAEMILRFPASEWACVSPTFADARDKQIESNESGLVKALGGRCAASGALVDTGPNIRQWNRSQGQLYLENDGIVYCDGADDGALRIQGTNLSGCWADEVGLWRQWETAWDESIGFAVRLDPARIIATGTPKRNQPARALVKRLIADPNVLNRLLLTLDNSANLNSDRLAELLSKYAGTRLGRQELGGEILEDGGGFFQRTWFLGTADRGATTGPFVLAAPPPGQDRRTRFWDLASTEPSDQNPNPDWTAGALVSYASRNRLWTVEHLARFRLSPGQRDDRIAQTARNDREQTVWVEQEPGSAGKSVIEYLDRLLGSDGRIVRPYRPTGRKGIRAEVLATVAERGAHRSDPLTGPGIVMVDGPWIPAFLDELEEFDPDDESAYDHDDQIDAICSAMSVLSTAPPSAASTPVGRKLNGGPTSVATRTVPRGIGSRW